MSKLEELDAKKVRIAYFWDAHKAEIEESKPGEPCYRLKILYDVASEFENFGYILKRSDVDSSLKTMSERALNRLLDTILYEISLL